MKLLIILSIFLLSLQTLAADLSLVRSSKHKELWKVMAIKGSYVALSKSKNENAFSLSGLDKKGFIEKLENDKKKMLSMMGISNWQVSKRSWKSNKSKKVLSLYGSYKDRNGNLVNFIEKHHYSKKMTHQALLTIVNKDALSFEKSLNSKLNLFLEK